jgi:hypothetical protein
MAQFNENIELLNAVGITVQLTNELAEIIAGGNRTAGSVRLYNIADDNTDPLQATVRMDGSQALIEAGGQNRDGRIAVLNENGNERIVLDGEQADIIAGGNSAAGDVYLFRSNGINTDTANATVHLDGQNANMILGGSGADGDVVLMNGTGSNRLRLEGGGGNIWLGGNGADGDIALFRTTGDNVTLSQATIHLDGQSARMALGGSGATGDIGLLSDAGENRVRLLGDGNLWLGGNGGDGDIVLFRTNGDNASLSQGTIHLDGQGADLFMGGNGVTGDIALKSPENENRVRLKGDGNLWLGGNGGDGDIAIFRTNGDNETLAEASIHLDGEGADLRMGCRGVQGDITLRSDANQDRVRLGGDGNLWLGGNGADGDLVIFRNNGDNVTLEEASIHLDGQTADLRLGCEGVQGELFVRGDNNDNRVRIQGDGNMWVGGNGADGDIVIFRSDGDNTTLEDATIHLDGQSGNIRCNDVNIPGADFAEDFDIDLSIADTLEPGTVMVLGRDGRLLESTQAFDRKVAGVVSGAGKYKAGITLDKQLDSTNRMPIALSGKVMCKVDASYGSIEVGDLITTSPRKGYAMKANDPYKSFGAVIGKALADFPQGHGMVPILVALQ